MDDGRIKRLLDKLGIGIWPKLIFSFLISSIIPIVVLIVIQLVQFNTIGRELEAIAITDSTSALTEIAIQNIERLTTDTARNVAEFLYARDADILFLAAMEPSEELFRQFIDNKQGRVVVRGGWTLSPDGTSWVPESANAPTGIGGISTNNENSDDGGFNARPPDTLAYEYIPLYDEITFIDLYGNELIKVTASASPKIHYPLNPAKGNVSQKENTYIKAETYFAALAYLRPGDIFVSDVIGAYVGTNYIGMYVPGTVQTAAQTRGYDIHFDPELQAYAGKENPNGQRFEGIIRWAAPVADASGNHIGYVTFALNHDHIMAFVDHITPMEERYTALPSAFEGNYAFIWDYQSRSICHPRHHSIVGFDPETGNPQIPWLESSIYDAWQASGTPLWNDFIQGWPMFDNQSRSKTPAPALTRAGMVGLDGRYLNNAPQCTGWMDLTRDGGSGSFYILWSGIQKLTTAAAIPYYTGQYAPSAQNGYSRRGFGFVTIGAGLEDFTKPVEVIRTKLDETINSRMNSMIRQVLTGSLFVLTLAALMGIWVASVFTGSINKLINGVSRFRAGERQFRFNSVVKDEFGTLADAFDDMAKNIVGSVNGPLSIIGPDGNIIYMNEHGLEIIDSTLEEVVGSPYSEKSIYPSGSTHDPVLALEEGHEAEVYHMAEQGRYIKGSASYFLNNEGERIGYIVSGTDVTEIQNAREKAEEASRSKSEFLSRMSHEMRTPMLVINGKAEIEYISNSLMEWLDLDADREIIGQLFNDLPITEGTKEFFTNAFGRDEFIQQNIMIEKENGHNWFMLRSSLLGEGNLSRVYELVDITELIEAKNEAEQATRVKNDFLAKMSHEIRTPMNAIIGMSELMLNETLNDRQNGYIRDIHISSHSLLGIINDILDFSKIESGKMELIPVDYDFTSLVDNLHSMFTYITQKKGLDFLLVKEGEMPDCLFGDDVRLRQILTNLCSNAAKFTSEGYLRMKITTTDDSVIFEIKDTGMGIREEELQKLFTPFSQADARKNRNIAGTGLGLTISRNFAEMMGGNITVSSVYGEGSVFTVTIPKVPGNRSAIDDGDASGVKHFRAPTAAVLVVDDNELNLTVAKGLLALLDIVIDTASSGKEALKRITEKDYDIVFMDHMMPEMDGIETTHEIRKMGGKYERQTVVALTANAIAGVKKMFLDNSFNDFISKPIEVQDLRKIIKTYLPPEKILAETDGEGKHEQLSRDEQLRHKVIGTFVKENKDTYTRFYNALSSGDTKTAHRIVHTLKSGAGYLGKTKLQDAAFSLEQSLQLDPPSHTPDQLHDLEKELEAALAELEPLIMEIEPQKQEAVAMDSEKLAALLTDLEALLQAGDYGASDYVDALKGITGMEELADLIDDYDYEGAMELLKQLK
ncbi:MAG: ATP-binding protein [Defluviitaleaceae bacterium]|nr:ATP-binding protein [Defluviitaleaceae bacterium]